MKRELISHSEWITQRIRGRLEGLTDEEYAWSPVPGAWHLRPDGAGGVTLDWEMPVPDPAPFTTLAWRLYHLAVTYSMDRNAEWLNLSPVADLGFAQPVDATSALRLLDRSIEVWFGYLGAVTEKTLKEPLGDKAGHFGNSNGADYVLHQIDEHIHHGAEVALLRDLYRAKM